MKPLHRVDGPPVKELGDLFTADHNFFELKTNQDVVTGTRSSYRTHYLIGYKAFRQKTKMPLKQRRVCLNGCLLRRISTDKSQEFLMACQNFNWTHDTSTQDRSETNCVIERAVRRVKEGTAATLVQSALPKEWWECVMTRYCYLRSVLDHTADGKTALDKICLYKL